MINQLFDTLSRTLQRSLDYRLQRHNLVAANIANTDTPNYVPVEMSFRDTLEAMLDGESDTTMSRPEVTYDPLATPGRDGNAVDIDNEMTKLTENSLQYDASSRVIGRRLSMLRHVISGGRG